ncbi:MAG: citramalate synthase [bacterium]
MEVVKIYDTTLRDGSQAEGVSLLAGDKLRIAEKLDELGVHYIEGGWPGSNPKDMTFFKKIKKVSLHQAKIAAFGSTHNAKYPVDKDPNILALIQAESKVITIFGKSWDLHVTDALNIDLERNLELIFDSIVLLKKYAEEVIYDAEHFFDGYRNNQEYALRTIKVAEEAGADCVVLCDTNGGTLPHEVPPIIQAVRQVISKPLGIHAHNDSESAVANSLMAIQLGVHHVQGTINGIGERCGNANLCSIIPNIKLKLGKDCISDSQLKSISSVSRFVNEIANLKSWSNQPYVGDSAFAHKGGIHVSAIQKNTLTYEHIQPALVGNHQRVLVSDQAGRSNLLYKAVEYGVDLSKDSPEIIHLLNQLKEMENLGFQFEAAEASFELLMKRAIGRYPDFFQLAGVGYSVYVGKRNGDKHPYATAVVQIEVEGVWLEPQAGIGEGPVNALDEALRKSLVSKYSSIGLMKLTDYKVSILNDRQGTAAKTRVLIESCEERHKWGTVGVSENIIEASWQALVDSYKFFLLKEWEKNNLQVEKIENYLEIFQPVK